MLVCLISDLLRFAFYIHVYKCAIKRQKKDTEPTVLSKFPNYAIPKGKSS